MPSSDTGLLNAAHQHAANADESLAQGLLPPARSSHQQASALFATCAEQATSDTTKRTLRQLSDKHSRAAHDLEARISKLRADGVDLSTPYKPKQAPRPSPSSRTPSATVVLIRAASPPMSPSKDRGDIRQRMSDSQAPGESFMVLGARSQGDPGDAFNKFWRAMEGLENRLSQPVAFTSVPLDNQTLNSSSSSSDSDADRRLKSTIRSRKPMAASSSSKYTVGRSTHQAGISSFPPPPLSAPHLDLQAELDEVLADDFDDLSESFCLIPSSSNGKPGISSSIHPAAPNSMAHLQTENRDLKCQLARAQAQLTQQAHALRTRADQDAELRASITLAKAEAQRVMAASMYIPGPSPASASSSKPPLPLPVPTDLPIPGLDPPPLTSQVNAQSDGQTEKQDARIKELETALSSAKVEIEKQRALIARFREKWEKLKENSKRKKSARAEAEVAAGGGRVNGGIAEEPEEEARALALDLAGDGLV